MLLTTIVLTHIYPVCICLHCSYFIIFMKQLIWAINSSANPERSHIYTVFFFIYISSVQLEVFLISLEIIGCNYVVLMPVTIHAMCYR